jgi:uncharacterized repeat protein (TIGR01451 family)
MATFFNQATLTYKNTSTTSNIVTGEIVQVLAAEKTAISPGYTTGERVTYVISIVNSGSLPFTDLTVTDDLGTYEFGTTPLIPLTYEEGSVRYYVNGVLQTAPTVTSTSPLVVSGINVPAGGNAIIVYEATANQFAPLGDGATIVNTATIDGAQLSAPVIAEEVLGAANGALLSITKELFPAEIPENGQLTYTFTIRNTGSTEVVATDNAVITDVFDPVLNITSVTYNGTAWAEGTNYTYDEATGTFTTLEGQITVPAAAYTQDPTSGEWVVSPGVVVVTVTGTI